MYKGSLKNCQVFSNFLISKLPLAMKMIFPIFSNHPKAQINKLDTAGVVYNIPYTGCTASYIGPTKRPLKTRITEHKKDVVNPPDK